MAGVTLEELTAYVGISAHELNKPCSDEHITSISLFLANWQTVAPHLGLTEIDEEDVEEEGKKTQDKRYKTLRKWKAKNLFKATYRVLVHIFLKLGRADVAEKVCRLLVDEGMYKSSTTPRHLSIIVLYHSIILVFSCNAVLVCLSLRSCPCFTSLASQTNFHTEGKI